MLDLAVGAERDSDGGTNRGAVYILFLTTSGTVSSYQKISDTVGSDTVGSFAPTLGNDDMFGWSLAPIGDLNGDGGARSLPKPRYTALQAHTHASWLIDIRLVGLPHTNTVLDLAVGAIADDDGGTNHGAVYILFLTTSGTVSSFQKISDTVGDFTATFTEAEEFGASVAQIGDLNNDGGARSSPQLCRRTRTHLG